MKFVLPSALLFAWGAAAQPRAGVESEWDVRKLAVNLQTQANHIQPVIGRVQPDALLANGAPGAYVVQWKTAQAELRYFLDSSAALAKQPERLTLALDTYFRMQALEGTLGSVIEGIRKYQNASLAGLIQDIMSENSANRDKLRQYIQDLAAQKEQEFQVADREAQRCRGLLLRQPPARTGRK
jgi:hypothetical protein